MPSAPPRHASPAALTGSGSQVRLAWRTVATWSMFTQRAGMPGIPVPGKSIACDPMRRADEELQEYTSTRPFDAVEP